MKDLIQKVDKLEDTLSRLIVLEGGSSSGGVALQATTPGTQQTGNANFSGKLITGGDVAASGNVSGVNITGSGTVQGATVNGTTTVQVNGSNVNPVPKNWIINGNMDVGQRAGPGGSTTVAAGQVYGGPDRWQAWRDGTGATVTLSQQPFTPGQTAVPGEPTYFLQLQNTVAGTGGTFFIVQQPIEDVRNFAGQTVTWSFWAKADAARNWIPIIRQNFGTGGSPVVDIVLTTCALTTSWQYFTRTTTLGSITSKTIGAGNYVGIMLWGPVNVTQTLNLAQVQLEAGSNASPFQKRSFAEEHALCCRYYQKSFNYSVAPAQNTGSTVGALGSQAITAGATVNRMFTPFPVAMRVAPTMTFYNPSAANAFARNTVLSTDATATAAGALIGEKYLSVDVTGPAGWAIGNQIAVHWAASSELT